MPPDDRVRLRHIVDAGEAVAAFIAGRARADLDQDRMLVFALVRAIEIMGEAASRLSGEARAATPTVPWAPMIAMRNRLVHAYFDIDLDILWRTAVEEVPHIVRLLKPVP
jgi:uncharacterized protein with HEPN domain